MFCAGAPIEANYESLPTYVGPRKRRSRLHVFTSVLLGVMVGTLAGFNIVVFLVTPESGHLLLPLIFGNSVSSMTSTTDIPDTSEELSLETLRDMVARTKGYWARDYSLYLGWNNASKTIHLNLF
jgi:hypothetical protein